VRIAATLALVLGLALAIVLVVWRGFGTIAGAMATLGVGVFLLPLVYAPHLFGIAFSWRHPVPEAQRPRFAVFLHAVWIGFSVETLLPMAGVAAELVKARLLIRAGARTADAASLAVVDLTVQSVMLAVWAAGGVALLALLKAGTSLLWPAVAGAAVLAVATAAFLLVQRAGAFGFLTRSGGRVAGGATRWAGLHAGAADMDRTLRTIHDRPLRLAAACAIRCLTRCALVAELWVAALLMGQPILLSDGAMLIGIVGALRAAAFILPGGWGLQEGGFVMLGGVLGLSPDFALALSLATRARELMLGVPALLVWHFAEGRSLKSLMT